MYKKISIVFFIFWSVIATSQKTSEQFPVFPNCESKQSAELENCFYNEVQTFVYQYFKVSDNLKETKTSIIVIFEV